MVLTEKKLCMMCTEYSTEVKCEHKKDCKLLNILRENKRLKQELRQTQDDLKKVKSNLEKSESIRNWEKYPDQMGRW